MARLICARCEHRVSKADVVCRHCGAPLTEPGAVIERDDSTTSHAMPVEEAPSESPADSETVTTISQQIHVTACPHCGSAIPDPRQLVCFTCYGELPRPAQASAGRTNGGPGAGADAFDPLGTRHEPRLPRWRLTFDFGAVELSPGEELLLGRDTPTEPARALAGHDNVSRRHVTVGVRVDGSAWARDERSTNGTFLAERRLTPGQVVDLTDGVKLRLASDVHASVELRADG